MIDRIVVVDSGQVIETTESAIIAKDEADRAEKWAKYSEEQANLASNNAIAAAASKEAAAQSAQSAANAVNGFDVHAAEKQQDFDDNAESKTNTYNSNASTLLQQYTDNAAQKLSAYNSNDATKTQAFNDNYTSKLNSFNSNASEKQAQVDASAETARKWAIGTISEQPNGSAKYWAGQAKTSTAGTLNESILTNCLTEIPQDIKLELSNGTLTLKAGSKVYNGDGTFYTNSSDISLTPSWGTVSRLFVFPVISGSSIVGFDATNPALVFSGGTAPTFLGKYAYWFDTTAKKVKYTNNSGSSWLENRALPLCLATSSNAVVTSIDQVFNGFGYIGNNTFILPGVKCRRTNGFNTDGSLSSIETTITKVTIPSLDTEVGRLLYFINNDNSAISNFVIGNIYVYDKSINNFITRNTKEVRNICFAYSVTKDSTGRITSLTPNTAFHATDYNEFAREVGRCAKLDETNEYTTVQPTVVKYGFSSNTLSLVKAVDNNNKAESSVNAYYTGNKSYIRITTLNKVAGKDFYLDAKVTDDGTAELDVGGSATFNLPTSSNNMNTLASTGWVNNKFQKVSTLPAQPDPNVTYLIPEE